MAHGFFGIHRHECLQFSFCPLVIEMGAAGLPVKRSELGPGIGPIHVNNPNGLNPRFRGLTFEQDGRLAGLYGVPEHFFHGD